MFQAQYLFKGNKVYSPWMNRQGDNIEASFDVVAFSAGINLKVTLVQKNEEDTGNGDPLTTDELTITTAGRTVKEWKGVKELVRFQFEAINGSNNYDSALFRMLTTVWFDTVDASV